jgi:integrase
MSKAEETSARVLEFSTSKKRSQVKRKSDVNRNKFGSVRNVGGYVYVDFRYLGERVRENSGLSWSEENKRQVRKMLDRIEMHIGAGTFKFAEAFPKSKKAEYFTAKEREILGFKKSPKDLGFGAYIQEWFELKSNNGTISGRTAYGYEGYIERYLKPYFGKMDFASINAHTMEEFIVWAKKRRNGEPVKIESIKKYFVVLRMVLTKAAIQYGWMDYNPFFGFEGFKHRTDAIVTVQTEDGHLRILDEEGDPILPFSIAEVKVIILALPDHWKPFFRFAVSSGLRPGELICLMPHDIDWELETVTVRRALTLDKEGHPVIGRTKNKYSRRTIRLTKAMKDALLAQQKIYDKLGGKYCFCSPTGCRIDLSNFRNQVWEKTLEQAKIGYRPIKQARHTFATLAISRGEDLSWIAKVMGHANTQMIHKHYARFIENANGTVNGSKLDGLFDTDSNDIDIVSEKR